MFLGHIYLHGPGVFSPFLMLGLISGFGSFLYPLKQKKTATLRFSPYLVVNEPSLIVPNKS